MRTLHRLTCTCIGLGIVFAGCAKKENTAASDTSAMAPAAGATTGAMSGATSAASTTPSSAAPVSLADVAGKWNMRSVPDSGRDTSATLSVLTATGTTSGWTLTFPGRAPVPMRVSTGGDSIVTDAGPFSSVRRKGVQVTTHTVMRMQNGMLVGKTVAHYAVKTPDSVLTLHMQATRAK